MNIAAESNLLIYFHSGWPLCPAGEREPVLHLPPPACSQRNVTVHHLTSVKAADRESPRGQALE